MIIYAFSLALKQMGDRRLSVALGICLAFSIGLLVLASIGFLGLTEPKGTLLIAGSLTVNLLLITSIWAMAFVATLYGALFFDGAATTVEARHYSDLPAIPQRSVLAKLASAVCYSSIQLVLNVLVLRFWVADATLSRIGVLWSVILYSLAFWALNGWLLGRLYFMTAARRHLSKDDARAVYKKEFGTVWAAGISMAVPLSVPVLNLIIPVLGAATFTHLVQLEEVEQDESDDLSSLTDREGSSGPDEEPVPVRRSQFVPLSEPTPSSSPSTSKDGGP